MGLKDKYFGAVYEQMKKKHPIKTAFEIASRAMDAYVEPSIGTKSATISQVDTSGGESITLGYPGYDLQSLTGGVLLDPAGWKKQNIGVITGDYEHIHASKLEGKRIDIDEEYHSFIAKASHIVFDEEQNALVAKVSYPDHPKTEEIKTKFENGELGISIEYAGNGDLIEYEEINGVLTPVLKDWQITGFTFTENPSYEKTKKAKAL